MYFEQSLIDQTDSHIINRFMITGLLECSINNTEEGARNTLTRWGIAIRARWQEENLTPQHDPNAYAALVAAVETHFKMTDMHQKKTHTLLESVLLSQNKMADEISKLSGLVRNFMRGSPHSASKKTERAVSSMKRSRIAVDFDEGMSEEIDCDGIETMDNHTHQPSIIIPSSGRVLLRT